MSHAESKTQHKIIIFVIEKERLFDIEKKMTAIDINENKSGMG